MAFEMLFGCKTDPRVDKCCKVTIMTRKESWDFTGDVETL